MWSKHAKFGPGPFLAKKKQNNLVKTTWSDGVLYQIIGWRIKLSWLRAILLSIIKASQPIYVPSATVVLDSKQTAVVVGVETILSLGPGGAFLSLINWGGVPNGSDITVTINLPKGGAGPSLKDSARQVIRASTRQVLDCTAEISKAAPSGSAGSVTCHVPGFQ